MPGPAFTTGDDVSLHPTEDEDHEFVQYGRNHPEVREPLLSTSIKTTSDVAEMLDDSECRFLICRSDGDADPDPVGVVAFAWVPESRRVGFLMYWVAPEHQGNGYVTEAAELFLDHAFRERGFHKVNAHVTASNAASAAVLEKLGFEREGTRRRQNFVDGAWEDEHLYGLLADEWLDG